jgi:hypothetical protein
MKTPSSPQHKPLSVSLVGRLALCALAATLGCGLAHAQVGLSTRWSIATYNTGDRTYVTTNMTERGIAYNPVTGHVLIVSRTDANGAVSSTPRVAILNAADGAEVGFLNVSGVTGGTFLLNQIAVAEDGAIFAGNLSGSSSAIPTYRLYRWADESAAPVQVFAGNPNGSGFNRYGDNMDIRGTGMNTRVLVASAGTQAAIFSPSDEFMTNFTALSITVSGIASGDMQYGVTFGPGDTFFAKKNGTGSLLRFIGYDAGTGAASNITSYTIAASISGISYNPTNDLLIGVVAPSASAGHQVNLYGVAGTGGTLPLIASRTFPGPAFANANLAGSVDLFGLSAFAVDGGNGVLALDITVPSDPTVAAQPGNATVVQGGYTSLSALAVGTKPLSYQWFFNETTELAGQTNASLLLTNVTLAQAGNYRIRVSNPVGATNSNNGVLTVIPTALSAKMKTVWKLGPGSRPYISGSDNNQRGLAYNPVTGNLLLVSRTGSNAVYVLDSASGAYVGNLDNNSAVITGGDLVLNLVGVDDEGVIYACNVTIDGTGATRPFKLYRWLDESPGTLVELAWQGDPGNGVPNRWGDTMAVRGSGENTQILLGSRNGTMVSIIQPTPGGSYSATSVVVPNATNGNFGLGIAWGAGSTFWGKGNPIYLTRVGLDFNQFPPAATILDNFPTSASLFSLGVDAQKQLLAGMSVENPDNVRLYDISRPDALVNLDTDFFPTDNPNSNGTGAVAFGGDKLFVLDSNNGILALEVGPRLRWTKSGSFLNLSWDTGYTLQSATEVTGPYQDVVGIGNSLQVNTATGTNFYQLRR